MKPIKIFKVGKHTSMQGTTSDYTQNMLADCVAGYSSELHEAPFVLGHPQHDDPAYGWVDHLELDSDGYLLAHPKQVDPTFAESVNAGKHNKVSASFYLPDSPNNPTPGKLYLRHLGFLGAQPPAVKGLGTVQFAENEEGVVDFISAGYAFELISDILRRQRDALIEEVGTEEADKQIPNWVIDSLNEVINAPAVSEQTTTSFSEQAQQSNEAQPEKTAREIELEQQLAQATAKIAAQDKAKIEASFAEFVDGLVADGKMPPKLKPNALNLLNAAGQQTGVVSFGEGEVALSEAVKTFLTQTFDSKILSFGEGIQKSNVDPKINTTENPLVADAKSRTT